MMLMWFSAALAYYGLTLSAGSLAGNIYVNATLSALTEVPAALLAIVLMERPGGGGRKGACFWLYFTGGAACALSGERLEFFSTVERVRALLGTLEHLTLLDTLERLRRDARELRAGRYTVESPALYRQPPGLLPLSPFRSHSRKHIALYLVNGATD
eukprot:895434-Prorocentrum_minimum.AAC.1